MTIAERLLKLVEYQTAIKEKITEKGGEISSSATLADVADALDTIQVGGGYTGKDLLENGLNLITEDDMRKATRIIPYAFYAANWLSDIDAPLCKEIGEYAFNYVHLATVPGNQNIIQNINLPECTLIGSAAFTSRVLIKEVVLPKCTRLEQNAFFGNRYGTTALKKALLPECVTLGSYAFAYNGNLTTISFPKCQILQSFAFVGCSALNEANFPECTVLVSSPFEGCRNLSRINFPKCEKIGSGAFANCTSLTEVDFPQCSEINMRAFNYCSNLTTASFPKCTQFYSYVFQSCEKLASLYLLGSSIASLYHSNAFSGTRIDGGSGSIFVRESLLDEWRTATNWVYFSDKFVGVAEHKYPDHPEWDDMYNDPDNDIWIEDSDHPEYIAPGDRYPIDDPRNPNYIDPDIPQEPLPDYPPEWEGMFNDPINDIWIEDPGHPEYAPPENRYPIDDPRNPLYVPPEFEPDPDPEPDPEPCPDPNES